MLLTNSPEHVKQLSLLESIAQCYFFDLPDGVYTSFRDLLPRKSHHYGQNWHKILNEDAEPFPLRKRPVTIRGIGRWIIGARQLWNDYKSYFMPVIAVLLLLSGFEGWNKLTEALRSIPELEAKMATLSPYFEHASDFNIPALRQSMTELQSRLPLSGTYQLKSPLERCQPRHS